MHTGGPRFGSGEEAAAEMTRFGIEKANLVLPPGMPDFEALETCRQTHGANVRLIGVPAGETEEQRGELTDWQIRFGISGLRLMPFEWQPNRRSAEALGEAGRWLFFINPYDPDSQRALLDWLERYPQGKIAAPHFIRPGAPADVIPDYALFAELLGHPRFCAIFSRHGECGAAGKYPHEDLRPWVEGVIELTGWDRVCWGSEYPVLYWRDETIPQAAKWLETLLEPLDPALKHNFLSGNAQRFFFDEPAPTAEVSADSAPDWSREWVAGGGANSPVVRRGIKLSAQSQRILMSRYLRLGGPEEERPLFSQFIAGELDRLLTSTES